MDEWVSGISKGWPFTKTVAKEQAWGCGQGWRNLMLRVKIRAKFVALEVIIKLIRMNETTKEETIMGKRKEVPKSHSIKY